MWYQSMLGHGHEQNTVRIVPDAKAPSCVPFVVFAVNLWRPQVSELFCLKVLKMELKPVAFGAQRNCVD